MKEYRMKSALFAAILMAASTTAQAQTPTCSSPWTGDHSYNGRFEVGHFYRDPYNSVFEVLARVCAAYEDQVDDLSGEVTGRTCSEWKFAVRNRQGRGILGPISKTVVFVDNGVLQYAHGLIPVNAPVRAWGKLPAGCFSPSVVVSVEDGAVRVTTTTNR
jgi:hypothetical protein